MATTLLTKKRTKWAEARSTPQVFKGTRLNYNASTSDKYVQALASLVKQMTAQTIREVRKLYESQALDGAAMDANVASQARILTNKLTAKFDSLFGRKAKLLAERMVNATDKNSKANLHVSLKTLSGGLSLKTDVLNQPLKTVITASVAENVSLIKSIPAQFMKDVTGAVLRSISTGQGLSEVIPALEKYEGVTLRRARNIALDQTRKAYNTINKERMQAVGVKRFEWVHSGGGQKPRELHIQMSGNIYSFDDLPVIDENTGERGIPGQAVNCRCTMVPVVEFGEGEPDYTPPADTSPRINETQAPPIVKEVRNDIAQVSAPEVIEENKKLNPNESEIKWTGKGKDNYNLATKFFTNAGLNVYDNPPGTKHNSRILAMYSPSNDRFYLNPRAAFWKDPYGEAEKAFKAGFLSTDNPMGVLHHELAHKLFDAPDNFFNQFKERDIAQRVSKYARSNPKEFVSETYAGLKTGKRYDDEVMAMYNRYARARK